MVAIIEVATFTTLDNCIVSVCYSYLTKWLNVNCGKYMLVLMAVQAIMQRQPTVIPATVLVVVPAVL